jgi:hypothetical protein
MGAAWLLLIIGLGLIFCLAVAAFFGFVVWTLVKAGRAVSAGAEAIETGRVPDLLPWSSPASISADWVGASTYTRGFGVKRDQASGSAQSLSQPGTVFAFQTDAQNVWRDGRLEAVGPFRLVLDVRQGLATVTRDGVRLGTLSLDSGDITGSGGNVIGRLVPDAAQAGLDAGSGARSALLLGNTAVAVLEARTESHEKRPAELRPLLLGYDPSPPDTEVWTVVACLVVMGWWGLAAEHAAMRTPGRRYR